MEYKEIKELAINYTHESDFWDTLKEYIDNFKLSSKDAQSLKFLINVETNKVKRELKTKDLEKTFNNCISFQAENINNKDRFVIFHPCTHEGYLYQLSYFDQYGAIMDEKSETLKEAIKNYYHVCSQYNIIKVVA